MRRTSIGQAILLFLLSPAVTAGSVEPVTLYENRESTCDKQELCKCYQGGSLNGLVGKYRIQTCENGVAKENPVARDEIRKAMKDDPQAFSCDSLKLDAYCHKALNCLESNRIQSCELVKPAGCNVDCSRTPRTSINLLLAASVFFLSAWA
eukprot:TRINITY_DN116243_c0_g1_i1.p1 TRINITY_DN116243_c0_g1~~TRINITY_DN116243_c0_g1_i1.p1  ORF type:complete len:151 (-),score=17.68 TRINITY_DN116243_c0_g1_i1:82-534(-)